MAKQLSWMNSRPCWVKRPSKKLLNHGLAKKAIVILVCRSFLIFNIYSHVKVLYVGVEFPLIAFRSLVSNVYVHFTQITWNPTWLPAVPQVAQEEVRERRSGVPPISGYIHWYRGWGVSPWDRFKKNAKNQSTCSFLDWQFQCVCDSSSFSGLIRF